MYVKRSECVWFCESWIHWIDLLFMFRFGNKNIRPTRLHDIEYGRSLIPLHISFPASHHNIVRMQLQLPHLLLVVLCSVARCVAQQVRHLWHSSIKIFCIYPWSLITDLSFLFPSFLVCQVRSCSGLHHAANLTASVGAEVRLQCSSQEGGRPCPPASRITWYIIYQ